MRRRRFVELLGGVALAGSATARGGVTGRELEVFSSSSLVGADGRALPADRAAVLTESTSRTRDFDGVGDPVSYTGATPVATVDGGVVGVGTPLVADEEAGADNVAAYLDAWDALVDGDTVLWDEGHDQFWTLDRFQGFSDTAADRGYDVQVSSFLEVEIDEADAVVMMPPRWDVWAETREALSSFVADGGTLFLHNQADFQSRDETARLNRVCEALGVDFRFNGDQVIDRQRNDGEEYEPLTTNLPSGSPFAGGSGGGGGSDSLSAVISGPTAVPPERSVTFDGSDSVDPDGRIARYEWSFEDGTTNVGRSVEHSWLFEGEYAVTLTVEGGDGETASATRTVRVSEDAGGGDESERVAVPVTRVSDGDTVSVRYEGREESVRVLGVDTAETPDNQQYEREEEWEGIDSLDVLGRWGRRGSEFASQEFSVGDTVEIAFDDAEGRRDPFDRLLAYVYYDAGGDGSRDALYNRRLIEEGVARVYGSNLTRHDELWRAEQDARAAGRGVWAESTPELSVRYRNRPVEEVFVPNPAPVTTAAGEPARERVPARPDAGGDPLVAVDEDARVAAVGGLMIDETFEAEEGFGRSTERYDNFALVSNLLDSLSARDGAVLIEGGHGQFGADWALSSEDAAYYQRHLEGEGVEFHQVNAVDETDLSVGRAIIVTTPASEFTAAERDALRSFRDSGGSVLLMGSANAPDRARRRLDDLAETLDSDLRFGRGTVRDPVNNLNGDPALPVVSSFDRTLPLFSRFTPGSGAPDDPVDEPGDPGTPTGATYEGSLSAGDRGVHDHAVSGDPEAVTLSLSGPSSADLDLYVAVDGSEPTPFDYDYRSWTFGSQETVVVEGRDLTGDTTLGVTVDCFSGSGDYTLRVTQGREN